MLAPGSLQITGSKVEWVGVSGYPRPSCPTLRVFSSPCYEFFPVLPLGYEFMKNWDQNFGVKMLLLACDFYLTDEFLYAF